MSKSMDKRLAVQRGAMSEMADKPANAPVSKEHLDFALTLLNRCATLDRFERDEVAIERDTCAAAQLIANLLASSLHEHTRAKDERIAELEDAVSDLNSFDAPKELVDARKRIAELEKALRNMMRYRVHWPSCPSPVVPSVCTCGLVQRSNEARAALSNASPPLQGATEAGEKDSSVARQARLEALEEAAHLFAPIHQDYSNCSEDACRYSCGDNVERQKVIRALATQDKEQQQGGGGANPDVSTPVGEQSKEKAKA
jgi:hypothetical protein